MAKGYRQSVEPYEGFDAEFHKWVHDGVGPEMVALIGPLMAGELEGGNASAATDAEGLPWFWGCSVRSAKPFT